jgi:hypothetical protein
LGEDNGAGRPRIIVEVELEPARFGSNRKHHGGWGASVFAARLTCEASGLGRCDGHHKLLFE